jgi:Lrp/AsnC family transcriptional regulator for asnA, asnC and gidA
MDKIDDIDKKMIDHLQIKGHQPVPMIAKELALPVRAVYRRLKHLKDNKTIMVIIRTNPLVLGYRFWVRIGIKSSPGCSRDVIRYLADHPSVYIVNEITGRYNILTGARFKTADQLTTFVHNELPSLPGIEKAETFLLIKPCKYLQFRWEYHEKVGQNTDALDASVSKKTFDLDQTDRNILDIITVEGQTSAQKLSKRLGIKAATVQRHLKTMAENQVYALDVKINPALANHEFIATLGIIVKGRSAQAVLDEIMLDETYITNASLCIGRFNIMLNFSFYRYDMINEYINVKLYNVRGINSIETYIHTKRYKYYVSQY